MDKRQYARISELIDVKCRILSRADKLENIVSLQMEGLTENISEGGILMAIDEEIKSGTLLELELDIRNSIQPIKMIGKVIRSEKVDENVYEIGIQFTHYNSKDKNLLNQFLGTII